MKTAQIITLIAAGSQIILSMFITFDIAKEKKHKNICSVIMVILMGVILYFNIDLSKLMKNP